MERETDNGCILVREDVAERRIKLRWVLQIDDVEEIDILIAANLEQSYALSLVPSVHLWAPFRIDADVLLANEVVQLIYLFLTIDEVEIDVHWES